MISVVNCVQQITSNNSNFLQKVTVLTMYIFKQYKETDIGISIYHSHFISW